MSEHEENTERNFIQFSMATLCFGCCDKLCIFLCLQCTLQCVMLYVMISAKLLAISRMRMSICIHVAETWVGGQCRSTCTRARERHIRLVQLVKVNLF